MKNQSFPTAKILEVEKTLSELLGFKIDLRIVLNTDYQKQKYETLQTWDILDKMPKFAKAMWTEYIVEIRFQISEEKNVIFCVADAKYKNTTGGSNGQEIAKFQIPYQLEKYAIVNVEYKHEDKTVSQSSDIVKYATIEDLKHRYPPKSRDFEIIEISKDDAIKCFFILNDMTAEIDEDTFLKKLGMKYEFNAADDVSVARSIVGSKYY